MSGSRSAHASRENPCFSYNGNLLSKVKPDGSATLYLGGLYEVDLTSVGVTTKKTSYYPGGAMRVDIVGGANTLYYSLKDHLGSASVLLKTDGTLETNGEQRYYPFGEKRLTSADLKTAHLFTGQLEVGLGGIYRYGARMYSPKLGRFLSADTIVPDWKYPQSLNRYSYVYNNPLKYVDPTGHYTECSGTGAFISESTGDSGISWADCWALQAGINDIENEFGVDVLEDAWTTDALDWIFDGLYLFRDAIGEEAYEQHILSNPNKLRLKLDPTVSQWDDSTNTIFLSLNVLEAAVETGANVNFIGTVVHELGYALAYSVGVETVEYAFVANANWYQQQVTNCWLGGLFCTTSVPQWVNPGDGPTGYARGKYGKVAPIEDAMETFTALVVPGINDKPITPGRRAWFNWFISEANR